MKTLIAAILILSNISESVGAHPQWEHLKESYKAQGDALFVPLYWLPETRQTVLKYIPDHENWVGFEIGLWKKTNEDKKLILLKELGVEFERLEGDKDPQNNKLPNSAYCFGWIS